MIKTRKNQQDLYIKSAGFTIVELVIVIVVIAILAAVVIVTYNGVTKQAAEAALRSDLDNALKRLGLKQLESGVYPNPGLPSDIQASAGNSFQYTSDGATYCLTGTSSNAGAAAYHVSSSGSMGDGACPEHGGSDGGGGVPDIVIADGSFIQTITSANCPTTRTRAVDARDNRTYWVQKLADGKCWMLTNLAYAGGGTNTYSDTKTITNGSGSSASYTLPRYYIPSGANATTEPTAPSTSTTGSGQYGYLYNWCAAMGGQATAACANASTPAPNPSISICPSGWRLPTGNGGEFGGLNIAINGGSGSTDAGLRSTWLAQRSGYWSGGFYAQNSNGHYWSSTQASAPNGYELYLNNSTVIPTGNDTKDGGVAVRCVAS